MEKVTSTLKSFGLTENEISVYLLCLKNSGISPYKIANLTKIPRTTVYDTLMNLSFKKLVTLEQSDGFTKQQTKVYAKNPSYLREIIQKKRDELSFLELDILDILPNLKEDFQKEKANANIQFFDGIEGFNKVYLNTEIIPEICWNPLIASDIPGRIKHREHINEFVHNIENQNSYVRELIPLNDWTKHVLILQTEKNQNYILKRNLRLVETNFLKLDTKVSVLKEKIYFSCASGNEVWGMIINSKALANTLKSIFELIWIQSKPITLELIRTFGKDELYEAAKKRNETI